MRLLKLFARAAALRCSRFVRVSWKDALRLFLDFFEVGPDGKMHKHRARSFPSVTPATTKEIGVSNYRDKARTVLVRSQRSGKVLRKLTWNGEEFQEKKL